LVLLACVCPTDGVGTAGWNLGAWILLAKHFWGGLAVALACAGNRFSLASPEQGREPSPAQQPGTVAAAA
jgi:hypothetical protein